MAIYLKIALLALSFAFPQTAYESELGTVSSAPSSSAKQVIEQPVVLPAAEIPEILKKIAFCESRDRQFDEDGSVLRGHNPDDIGKYQINEKIWGQYAQKLGFDLHTEEGNEAMALQLYQRYHTKPWVWSQKCWSKNA